MNSPSDIRPSMARNTFGIEGHSDILHSHLQERSISLSDYKNGYITEDRDRNKDYKLLIDHRTLNALYERKAVFVMVSFQKRTNGNFAVARLHRYERKETND